MNVTGPSTTFHQMSAFQLGVVPGAESTPQHATSAGVPVPAVMPQAGPSYLPVSGASFFSVGYFALAPQMDVYGGAQGYASGAGAQPMILMPVFFAIAGQAPMGGQMPQAGEQPAAVPAAAVPEPAAPVPEVVPQEPVSPVAPSVDEQVVPPVDEADPETEGVKPGDRAVVEVAAEEFARFRKRELNAELATSLVLELTTSEGDSVRLDFSQFDVLERSSFKGMTEDGERSRSRSSEESSERLVNMSVDGELNAEEKASGRFRR
jgi:hypothetical protein